MGVLLRTSGNVPLKAPSKSGSSAGSKKQAANFAALDEDFGMLNEDFGSDFNDDFEDEDDDDYEEDYYEDEMDDEDED